MIDLGRWAVILARAILYTVLQPKQWQSEFGYVPEFYQQIKWPLLVFQTAAILEVSVLQLEFLHNCVAGTTLHSTL